LENKLYFLVDHLYLLGYIIYEVIL